MLYVGSYTDGANGQAGIHVYGVGTSTGSLRLAAEARGVVNPSYLAARGGFLYAVSEMGSGARISAYAANQEELRFVNSTDTEGSAMCHISAWPRAPWLTMANYNSGSVVTCAILEDGRVGAVTQTIQLEGRSQYPARQRGPHAHSAVPSPDGRFFFVPDLGTDRVYIYQADIEAGLLAPNGAQRFVESEPGAGPRHIVFSPDGERAYLLTEKGCSVMAFEYNPGNGTLRHSGSARTLSHGWTEANHRTANSASAVRVSPDGRFVYASNRGMDNIAVFATSASNPLNPLGHYPSHGQCPRDFCLSPNGEFIAVANQTSGSLYICPRDAASGAIGEPVSEALVPNPACVLWI